MLNLYLGITPNYESTHYYFSNFANYLTFLSTKLLKQIEPSAFTINYNRVRVRIDNTLTITNYKSVTYIVNTDDEKCYLVNNAIVQSGYVDFNITVDNWGTYISKASFKDILVQRCNRKINNYGIYDNIQNTINFATEDYTTVYNDNLCILVSVVLDTGATRLLGCRASDLINEEQTPTLTVASYLQFVSTLSIAKIIEFEGGGQIGVTVLNVYLAPYGLYNEDPSLSSAHILLMGSGGSPKLHTTYSFRYMAPKKVIETAPTSQQALNINKDYIIGSNGDGLKITRRTALSYKYNLIFQTSVTDLYVDLYDGLNHKDMTKHYTFTSSTSVSAEVAQRNSAKALSVIASIFQLGASINNPLKIGRSGMGLINAINAYNYNEGGGASVSGGGDASLSYSSTDGTSYSTTHIPLCYPIKLYTATSYINENEKARKTGATFNEYISNIANIFNYSLLGTGATDDDTFVQIDAEIEAIPLDATNEIRDKLKNGVYLQQLL